MASLPFWCRARSRPDDLLQHLAAGPVGGRQQTALQSSCFALAHLAQERTCYRSEATLAKETRMRN